MTPVLHDPMKRGDFSVSSFDHPTLFGAVKARDIEKLHNVLGPTLIAFGSYQVKYWDHARDGILTSLNAIPGKQGYDCLRWAERILNESHQISRNREPRSCYAKYVYKLRASILEKAIERIPEFRPLERPRIRASISEAIAALKNQLSEEDPTKSEWLLEIQGRIEELESGQNGPEDQNNAP